MGKSKEASPLPSGEGGAGKQFFPSWWVRAFPARPFFLETLAVPFRVPQIIRLNLNAK
ncbi:MAG: hypothetical protein ACRD18_11000 [Terriglobia bacterium]